MNCHAYERVVGNWKGGGWKGPAAQIASIGEAITGRHRGTSSDDARRTMQPSCFWTMSSGRNLVSIVRRPAWPSVQPCSSVTRSAAERGRSPYPSDSPIRACITRRPAAIRPQAAREPGYELPDRRGQRRHPRRPGGVDAATDLVVVDAAGALGAHRQGPDHARTSRTRPSRGCQDCSPRGGRSPSAIPHMVHGTTLFTNALIEHKAARTALITTRGLRDATKRRRYACACAMAPIPTRSLAAQSCAGFSRSRSRAASRLPSSGSAGAGSGCRRWPHRAGLRRRRPRRAPGARRSHDRGSASGPSPWRSGARSLR